jgi:hypothetical protein
MSEWREPPEGWFAFGTHVDQEIRLEFSDEAGEDGLPRWERPYPPTAETAEFGGGGYYAYDAPTLDRAAGHGCLDEHVNTGDPLVCRECAFPPARRCTCTRRDLALSADPPEDHPWEPGEGKCPDWLPGHRYSSKTERAPGPKSEGPS